MQVSRTLFDMFNMDSLNGYSVLMHETDNMMLALRIIEENLVIIFNNYDEDEYFNYLLLHLNNFGDLGYELASFITWIKSTVPPLIRKDFDILLDLLQSENFEASEEYFPEVFYF